MAEELQSLLERIQKDGIDKANREAEKILADAKQKAADILKDAEEGAAAALKKAEEDGRSFAQRGETALRQAARDVVLSVREAIDATIRALVQRDVTEALTTETLQHMLVKVVDAYCSDTTGESRIEILVPENQKKDLADFCLAKFADTARRGLEIKAAAGIVSGFSVSVADQNVQHDFTADAIADALCQFLRPSLADIVQSSRQEA